MTRLRLPQGFGNNQGTAPSSMLIGGPGNDHGTAPSSMLMGVLGVSSKESHERLESSSSCIRTSTSLSTLRTSTLPVAVLKNGDCTNFRICEATTQVSFEASNTLEALRALGSLAAFGRNMAQ